MKKNLLATLLSLFVLLGINQQAAMAQTLPAATCGYTAVAPTVVEVACSNGTTVMPDNPGTGSPNYSYLISTIPDTVIVAIVDAGEVFDPAAAGLAEGDAVYVTGFGYDEANILAIISSVGGSPLCALVLDPAVCAALAATTTADLGTLLELAESFSGETPTVNTLLGLIETVSGLGAVLGAPAPCYSAFAAVDYVTGIEACSVVECDASTGTISTPATLFACNDGSNISELAVEIPTDTNTPNYLFIVTSPETDDLGDPLIVGVTYDGTYDFTGFADGDYCYYGFAYDQAELDALAATLNGFLPVLSLPTIPIPADLGVIFATFGGLLGDLTIPTVLGFLTEPPIPIPLPPLCYAVSETPAYCITVGTCSVACDVDGGTLSTEDATTFCTNDGIADVVTVTTTSGPGGEQLITITYDATKGTTGLVGAESVYMHSGAGFSGPGSAWESVIGNWGQDDGVGQMYSVGEDLWQITVDASYYGLAPGTTIYGIGMVFRNPAGNLEGKDYNNQDIYVREINTGSPVVLQADGAPFDGVFAATSSTVSYEYIIADAFGNVLFGPDPGPSFDFEGAPEGTYLIWGIAYEGTISVGATLDEIVADCYELSSNVIFITAESCSTPCEASYGEIFFGETTLCEGGSSGPVVVQGDNIDGFTTVLVITQGAELTIIEVVGQGSIDFSEYAPGNYTVHAFNILNDQIPFVDDALANGIVTTGVEVAGLIADGTLCAQLDVAGIVFTILPSSNPACGGPVDDLTVGEPATTIGGDFYVAVFSILTGSGDYTVEPVGTLTGNQFVSNPISCNDDATFVVADNVTGQLVLVTVQSPCSVTPTCEASFGTVTAPANTFLCNAGVISEPVTVSGDATGDYNTIFVITSGAELVIQGISATGSIDFTGYANGTYTVHAFNYSLDDEATILAAVELGVTTGFDVAGLIADGVICAALDVAGVQFTISSVQIFLLPTCNNQTGTVDLSVTVTGGTPDPVDGYTIGGTLFGTNTGEQGNPFTIPGIADQDAYTVIVTDALGCSAEISGTANCTKCPENELGSMADALVVACAGGSVTATISSSVLEEGSFVGYALHTNPVLSPAEILAESTSGTFSQVGSPNTVYYISALAGNIDNNGNGVPDVSDPCTTISTTSTPVVFLTPVVINLDAPNCDNTTGLTTYAFSLSGGYPAFMPGASYTLSGEISGDGFFPGAPGYQTPAIGDATTWFLTATDEYGCSATVSATTNCEKGNYVSWLSFTGKVQDNGNLLKWVTASEVDNDYFMVERSFDGANFTEISRTNGAGTSYVTNSYQYLDQTAPSGISYYRITQVDFNGQSSATEVIALTRNRVEFSIGSVVPVPASSFVTLTVNAVESKGITISLFDVAGRFVASQQDQVHDGVNTISVDVRTLPAGMYFVTVTDGTYTATEKLVKE